MMKRRWHWMLTDCPSFLLTAGTAATLRSSSVRSTGASKEGAHLPKRFHNLLMTTSLLPGITVNESRAEGTVHSANGYLEKGIKAEEAGKE